MQACKEALNSLKGNFGILGDAIQSAKRTLINRYYNDLLTNKYWVEAMSGTHARTHSQPDIQSIEQSTNELQTEIITENLKTLSFISNYEEMINSVTINDMQLLVDILNFSEDNMTSCVAIASPKPPRN